MKYDARGVSASKSEVHDAIQNLDKGLFPNAFCKILPDLVAGDQEFVNIMHADTAGTKPILSYLYWKETGNNEVWSHIIQDALVMNLDDMACVGCIDNIVLSSTIGRNKHLIPGEVLKYLIQGTEHFVQKMKSQEINLILSGGETADVGDVVRTLDVGFTTFGRLLKAQIQSIEVESGDLIVGLASYGQASYEDKYNSGIGSNGLTSARHDLLSKHYEQYPESFDPNTESKYRYCGQYRMTDQVEVDGMRFEIGQLLTSPTRTYLPVLKKIFNEIKTGVNGIVHCTGGAQAKVMKFVKNKRIIKDNLLPIAPIFNLIHSEVDYSVKELFSVFNMGHRMELYVRPEIASSIIDIAKSFHIDAQVIGRVEAHSSNELVIESKLGNVELHFN